MTDPTEPDEMGESLDNPTGDTKGTALLPNDFFVGKELKPGHTCKVRIDRVLDGQCEVSYVPEDQRDEDDANEGYADEEMQGYMEA